MKAKTKNLILIIGILVALVTNCTYDSIPGPGNCSETPVVNVAEVIASECGKANGGFTIVTSENELIEFSIDGNNFQADNAFSNLQSGIYQVSARNPEGCISNLEVEISNLSGFNVTVTENPSSCSGSDGSLQLLTNGGTPPFQYQLNDGAFQPNNTFNNLSAGEYAITVQDATDCKFTLNAVIKNTVAFSEIKAIINTNCAISGCHNGSVSPNLTNDNTIKERADRIKARTGNKTMPPSSSSKDLSEAEIEKIKCWSEGNI